MVRRGWLKSSSGRAGWARDCKSFWPTGKLSLHHNGWHQARDQDCVRAAECQNVYQIRISSVAQMRPISSGCYPLSCSSSATQLFVDDSFASFQASSGRVKTNRGQQCHFRHTSAVSRFRSHRLSASEDIQKRCL